MAIETVSISDIGASLIAIETEIKSNISSIEYHKQCIEQYKQKNSALKDMAQVLIRNAMPVTLGSY